MALRDIYEANKTTAEDQETAVVGTRQQQTLGKKDSMEREMQRITRCLCLDFGKNSVLLSNKSTADSDEASVAFV